MSHFAFLLEIGIMHRNRPSSIHHSFIPCPSDLVTPTYVPNILSPHSTKNQLKDIVEDEVASSTVREELKGLAVVHRSLLIVDQKSPSDEDQNSTMLSRRLCIEG